VKLCALVGVASFLAVSSGCVSRMVSSNFIRGQGEVLKQSESGGHRYYVVRSGNFVRKWDQLPNGAAGVLYEVDTVTQICKSGATEVDCNKLKRDPDIGPYVTW